jgi:hypothetical protein
MQFYMVRPYTVWKKTRVQFSLKNACANNFTLDPNEVKKKKSVQFSMVIAIGSYDCYRSLWNKLEKRYWKYQIKIYYVHFRL